MASGLKVLHMIICFLSTPLFIDRDSNIIFTCLHIGSKIKKKTKSALAPFFVDRKMIICMLRMLASFP